MSDKRDRKHNLALLLITREGKPDYLLEHLVDAFISATHAVVRPEFSERLQQAEQDRAYAIELARSLLS